MTYGCAFPGHLLRGLAVGVAGLLLVACETVVSPKPVERPTTRPAPVNVPQPTSERSAALRAYLAQVQSAQLSQGLLRQDGGGPDTPYSAAMLHRNFNRIVFFNEYAGGGQPRGVSGRLRRWEGPVRFGTVFGDSVPPSQRQRDQSDVARYANRLARVTGHPVAVGANPNFLVLLVSEDDRTEVIQSIAGRLPGVGMQSLAPLLNLTDDVYCAVAAYATGVDRSTYTAAVAVIRAENPDLLRLSCIHEELAQGLGLANDSPDARPSIFNDDDEFALLTSHDEDLLAMLYDNRLRPGLTLSEADEIVRALAAERRGGPS